MHFSYVHCSARSNLVTSLKLIFNIPTVKFNYVKSMMSDGALAVRSPFGTKPVASGRIVSRPLDSVDKFEMLDNGPVGRGSSSESLEMRMTSASGTCFMVTTFARS